MHWTGLHGAQRPRPPCRPSQTSPAAPPPQLKSLLDTEFRTINDFRSKAPQYKPHNTPSGAGDAKTGRKGAANGVAVAAVPAA